MIHLRALGYSLALVDTHHACPACWGPRDGENIPVVTRSQSYLLVGDYERPLEDSDNPRQVHPHGFERRARFGADWFGAQFIHVVAATAKDRAKMNHLVARGADANARCRRLHAAALRRLGQPRRRSRGDAVRRRARSRGVARRAPWSPISVISA